MSTLPKGAGIQRPSAQGIPERRDEIRDATSGRLQHSVVCCHQQVHSIVFTYLKYSTDLKHFPLVFE